MTGPEDWIVRQLAELSAKGLRRELRAYPGIGGKIEMEGRTILNFSSNDYLDLANHPAIKKRVMQAVEQYGCGATASRLMTGTTGLHEELEARLAGLKRREAALVFGSGYLANVGVISVLVARGDAVFSDRLNHASIVDGIRLSGAKLYRYRHCDCEHLESLLSESDAGRRLVVTDSVFSMDGDVAPLSDLIEVCRRHDAILMIDEAHATGVFGPNGAGAAELADPGHEISIDMGTLSKALGGYGGFVAGSELLRDLLINRARSFTYTTALPPASVASALAALDILEQRPNMGAELLGRAEFFRSKLRSLGFDTLGSCSQIIPLMVGDNDKALAWSRRLAESGLLAVAVRPPTVPVGTARLRLSVTLAHDTEDLERAAEILQATAEATAP